jgi:hypothetical protein
MLLAYRDKKVVGVFVLRFRAPSQINTIYHTEMVNLRIVNGFDYITHKKTMCIH